MDDGYYNSLDGYILSFTQHLKDTSTRLGLRLGSLADEDRTEGVVSEAHALVTWTPAELDAFFRAVSVHSRWRPDLIAACVPTRSEWEVWMYLEALEEGATRLAVERGDEDVDMEDDIDDSSSGSHSSSNMDEDGEVCEPAYEVSQAWVDMEERMASWITNKEYRASIGDEAVTDPEETEEQDPPPKRKRGRPRGTFKRLAEEQVRDQTVPGQGPCLTSSDFTSTPTHEREALMAHLKVPHLVVLDSMLREDDRAMDAEDRGREVSVPVAISVKHEDKQTAMPRETSEASQSPSNTIIDPVEFALSGSADSVARQLGESTSRGHAYGLAQETSPTRSTPAPTPFDVSSQAGSPDTTTSTNPDPNADFESDPSLLSPRSRRRIQKRLYMRRKRASEKGTASDGAIDTRVQRLKPGRKTKSKREETLVPSDSREEWSEGVPKKCRGLTLPYKLKAQFTELGIDEAHLRSQGMDLLNMSALGKLMGLYSSLERGEEVDEAATAQFIDAELIRHLQAAMVWFVTDVIHRAIVWRERELRLKRRSQVWRHGDQIAINAIEHAVKAIGARYASHKEYFRSLEALQRFPTEPSDSVNASETLDPVDPDVHRGVYTPLVCPPPVWRMGPLTCLTRTYEREATRTRRGMSAEMEEEVMSDETDAEALEAEMAEEEEMDACDLELSRAHEEHLWGRLDIT